jgi:hypothetical protein
MFGSTWRPSSQLLLCHIASGDFLCDTNSLTGPIPNEVGNWTGIGKKRMAHSACTFVRLLCRSQTHTGLAVTLGLGGNLFTGTIPSSIGFSTKLGKKFADFLRFVYGSILLV